MTKVFQIKELQELVAPDDLIDVLESLLKNGFLSSYYYDYVLGEVELDIPKNVEINEIMDGFQEHVETGRKKVH